MTFYDQRGGGIETSLKGDKQGLGLTKRNKKHFEAQHMLVLLGSLAHNVVVWARKWLSSPQIQRCGILRMVSFIYILSLVWAKLRLINYTGHSLGVTSVARSPDGKRIASGGVTAQ